LACAIIWLLCWIHMAKIHAENSAKIRAIKIAQKIRARVCNEK
jgi:hypothetical protein